MKPFLLLLSIGFIALTLYSGVILAGGEEATAYLPVVYKAGAPPTSTAIVTGTVSASPTAMVTATPTRIPYLYDKDENPNLPIPDGPKGVVTTTLNVPDPVIIREFRVFLNVEHDEVSDLEITMIAPNGARLLLHSQGQDAGNTAIRRWIPVIGSDLESIRGTLAEGAWALELRDQVENLTGELLGWALEIYP